MTPQRATGQDQTVCNMSWEDAYQKFSECAGDTVPVKGDGFCWLYAVLAGMGCMENPASPSEKDYDVSAEYLRLMKEWLEVEGQQLLTPAERDHFLALDSPTRNMPLLQSNYGRESCYRVVARYNQSPILLLDHQALMSGFESSGKQLQLSSTSGMFTRISYGKYAKVEYANTVVACSSTRSYYAKLANTAR